VPISARADDLDDLLIAHNAYTNGEYSRALPVLRALADQEVTTSRQAVLVTAARKYHAACLFAQQQEGIARAELTRMLRDDPDATLDQAQFEPAFLRLFEAVQRDMQPELQRIRTQRVVSREQAEAARRSTEALARHLLTRERQMIEVPRSMMWVPFGVGQFMSGNNGLGVFFLTSELLLMGACAATLIAHQSIYPANGRYDFEAFDDARLAQGLEIANWVSAGILGAVIVAGMIEANVSYRPMRGTREVPRPLPPELEGFRIAVSSSSDGSGAVGTLRLTF
jgi:hypothetical protein